MKKILVLVCVLFIGFQMNACARHIVVESPNGKNRMIITCKPPTECEVTKPHGQKEDPKSCNTGDLVLNVKGDELHGIIDVPDGTEIVTSTNPNCRWRFFGNQAFYICDSY